MKLIPSIDLRGGQCVRLLHGDFRKETIYDVDPVALAERYAGLGATLMHIVDLDGARDGALANRALLASMTSAVALPVQVGGGLRSRRSVQDLLALGVARAIVGSAAIDAPDEVAAWLEEFGPERIGLALDIRLESGVPLVQTRGWTQGTTITLWESIDRFLPHGLRHVLCTDVGRDGAMTGPNIELYRDCVRRYPSLSWQASGGVRDRDDLSTLRDTGVAGAVSGRALLEGRLTHDDLRAWSVV